MKALFIDVDTLRPDHLGCYGYERNTSPNIDQFAKDSIRFENYYTSDAPCLPSRASLISGQFGLKHGAVGHGGTAADRRVTGEARSFFDEVDVYNFNNIFRRAGMYTASISTFPERHSSWWFNAGFNETFNEGHRGLESGEAVLPYAMKWLEDNGVQREDWYLHLHLWDPHTPYRVPEEFGNPFENDGKAGTWIDDETLEKHISKVGPHSASELNMFDDKESPKYPRNPGKIADREGLVRCFDGYDCGVAYTDYLVGLVFDKLKELGIYDDMAIILTADHGENFGELGIYAEHATADQACCHIPFIIKWPGGMKNIVDSELHYHIDLLPTLSDLFEVEKGRDWDGESFVNTILKGEKQGRESLVISQMSHVCQRSARFGDWLYIRTYHDGFHLFGKEMLFNIKEDVHEQHDVKDQYPEICAQGAKIILEWHDDTMMNSQYTIDPLWTVLSEGGPFHVKNQLDTYCKRLEETGRSEGAKELRRRHGQTRKPFDFSCSV